jgi:hypothetical protein
MSKATPRPWSISRGVFATDFDVVTNNNGKEIFRTHNNADAELIVRAVNCHDELVEKLDLVFYALNNGLQLTEPDSVENLLKRARGSND